MDQYYGPGGDNPTDNAVNRRIMKEIQDGEAAGKKPAQIFVTEEDIAALKRLAASPAPIDNVMGILLVVRA